jgi:hypothetical protein
MAKIDQTPSSDRATTRKPETAPPRIATWTASTRLRRAADATRTFALTLTSMPMIPQAIEQAAPSRNAPPVRMPMSIPTCDVSATLAVSSTEMIAKITTEPASASRPIVVYWRLMNATAPSLIVAETSIIAWVPVSRDRTSRAR